MTFEGDDESVEIPDEMFDEEERATLAPVFAGYEMQAEVIRSVLESNDIPAVVFGPGYEGGLSSMPAAHRVMVRATDVENALDTIRDTELPGGEVLTPTSEDIEVMVNEDFEAPDTSGDYDSDPVPVLAGGSDWGPRIVGLIGVAALVIAIVVLVSKAN